jgi:hypothetical protein
VDADRIPRQPRQTRVGRIPGGKTLQPTVSADVLDALDEARGRLGTTTAETHRTVIEAGILLLKRAAARGIEDVTAVDALLASPGRVQVRR